MKKNPIKLGDVSFITDGQHGYHIVDPSSEIKHITAKCIKGLFVDYSEADRLHVNTHKRNLRSSLQPDDVLISTAGTIGNVGIVTPDVIPANLDQDVARVQILNPDKVHPSYLVVFLSTRLGQLQIQRETTGQVQQHLALEKIRLLKVPIIRFQDIISKIVKRVASLLDDSKNLIINADKLLLLHCGVSEWNVSTKNTFTAYFSQAISSPGFRLDPEYYHPKYDELFTILERNAIYCRRVAEIAEHNGRGMSPEYKENGELKIINSQHILEHELDYNSFDRTGADNWDIQAKARVYENDILTYSTGANVGRTAVYLEKDKALAGIDVNILRLRGENPIYVGFVINSNIGRMQTNRLITGSAQAHLYSSDIDQFVIPFVDKDIQDNIVGSVLEAHQSKKKAKQLLDIAKRAVEIGIEDSEDSAMMWLNDNMKQFGITL